MWSYTDREPQGTKVEGVSKSIGRKSGMRRDSERIQSLRADGER